MNLQEFIEQSLLQIAQATKNVTEQMRKDGLGEGVRDNNSINVSFDVAVTVSHEATSDTRGGLQVLKTFRLGSEDGEVAKAENVSRIKLELPLKIAGAKSQPTQIG